MALFATLPQHGDLVIHDELIHASVREGLKRSRARAQSAAHNDVDSVADGISAYRRAGHTGTVWIAVESLYSMDGDCAPLEELASLADANEAVLVVDEAHATGIFGVRGVGLAHALEGRANVITLHTFGKALGCEGALVCGPETAMDFLVNRARSFIFTTAPSPLIAAIARGALEHISGDHGLQDRLAALVAHAGRVFQSKLGMVPTGTHIQPLIIGENEQTMAVSRTCRDYGFDVRGIRPPTVPDGTSRLRLSLTLNARPGDVDALAAVLENAL
jgi:8-amino-7-oxononanoate synthase